MTNMRVRGIRGATTVNNNHREEIVQGTKELLLAMVEENQLDTQEIASIFFTVTSDLTAEFPASAARVLGWDAVPLLCATEIPVPDSKTRCIRILMHVNTNLGQQEIKHVYLREAISLRPDLSEPLDN